MSHVMMSLHWPGEAPTAEQIEARYALPPGSIDRQFGVIEVDDLNHEYTFLIEPSLSSRFPPDRTGSAPVAKGPFSNPPIDALGPPSGGGRRD